jgi:hypothetical protein
MTNGLPIIVAAECISYSGLMIKKYVLDSFLNSENSTQVLQAAIDERINEFSQHGSLGIAFMYGYEDKKVSVQGIDLALYRETEGAYAINPMLHTWTLERNNNRPFQALDRSQDGTLCALEAVILGREAGFFMYIDKKKPGWRKTYTDTFPALPRYVCPFTSSHLSS